MKDKKLKCEICGNRFSSEEYLEDHFELEHPDNEHKEFKDVEGNFKYGFRYYLNRSAIIGFVIGFLMATAGISGAFFLQDLMKEEVEVTVITCDECSYERFKTATDRMFEANYNEVDYESSKGEDLIAKYDLNYIPGFIFEKNVEEKENFTQVRGALVEFEDAYVISDAGEETAQRFSEGFSLRTED